MIRFLLNTDLLQIVTCNMRTQILNKQSMWIHKEQWIPKLSLLLLLILLTFFKIWSISHSVDITSDHSYHLDSLHLSLLLLTSKYFDYPLLPFHVLPFFYPSLILFTSTVSDPFELQHVREGDSCLGISIALYLRIPSFSHLPLSSLSSPLDWFESSHTSLSNYQLLKYP